ncbi:MAG: helix-turn-helix domain-containing protein [Acutalibacteraceae bacterium]|nr:helix-turn-helix domain-containing protein [Acutalibacteraceae bacterium]
MENRLISKGFYQPDLKIEYNECVEMSIVTEYSKPNKGYYRMLYVANGKYEIIANGEKFIAENGALIISNPTESFITRRLTVNAVILKIDFHRSLVENYTDYNALKLFHALPCGWIFYPANFESSICYELLNSLKKSIIESHNRFYVMTKVLSILSELNLYYDDIKKEDKFDKSNIALTVLEYVKSNFTENITYKSLRDKFFICDSTINKIFKRTTGLSFKEYLNSLRLNYANDMMHNENNELKLAKIAELSGYKTYSTFYREYINEFGVSPSEVYSKNIINWPLE